MHACFAWPADHRFCSALATSWCGGGSPQARSSCRTCAFLSPLRSTSGAASLSPTRRITSPSSSSRARLRPFWFVRAWQCTQCVLCRICKRVGAMFYGGVARNRWFEGCWFVTGSVRTSPFRSCTQTPAARYTWKRCPKCSHRSGVDCTLGPVKSSPRCADRQLLCCALGYAHCVVGPRNALTWLRFSAVCAVERPAPLLCWR